MKRGEERERRDRVKKWEREEEVTYVSFERHVTVKKMCILQSKITSLLAA